jgi:hypothetical protein
MWGEITKSSDHERTIFMINSLDKIVFSTIEEIENYTVSSTTPIFLSGPLARLPNLDLTRGSVAPSELLPLPYHLQTPNRPLLYQQSIYPPLHVSHPPYGFLVLQPSLQLPADHHQRFGRIQEAHEERPTCTSPHHRAPILQFSQYHSRRPSAATPRARSVPKK